MPRPRHDSVFDEPGFRPNTSYTPDPSERSAAANLAGQTVSQSSEADRAAQSVWDEPGISPALAGTPPAGTLTYATWLAARIRETGWFRSWIATFTVALLAGPWAILGAFAGAFLRAQETSFGILAIVVFAPVIEETMKAAAILYVVEKMPYLFRSGAQIIACAAASGLAFAAVENVMYLKVYIADPSPAIIAWRWSVCVALHTGCTVVAALGLVRAWRTTTTTLTPPNLATAAPYLALAAVIHGAYNGSAVLMDMSGYKF